MMMTDAHQLAKALNEVKATPFQITAAATLLSVCGLENALEFVQKMGELNQMRKDMQGDQDADDSKTSTSSL